MQVLEQLFDSPIKVKLLKLFLRNPEKIFQIREAAKRIQFDTRSVRQQIEGLYSIRFLRRRKVNKKRGKKKTKTPVLKPGIYFGVNPNFEFYNELSTLVLKSSPTSKKKMLRDIKKLGRIKLALISGVFLNTDHSRIDLLIIGDDINQKRLKTFLFDLESEVGKEISYSLMNTKEFKYRYHMFDRFLRDILEKPHEKLINKLGI